MTQEFKDDCLKLDKAIRNLTAAGERVNELTVELSIKYMGGKISSHSSLLEYLKLKVADEILYEGK
jgi:hypothetical protein